MIELQPKKRFLLDDDAARKWLEMSHSAAFLDAAQAAIAEMTMRQGSPEGLEAACRANYRMEGAKKFLEILLNLGEPESSATQPNIRTDNLLWQPPHSKHKPQPPAAKSQS